MLLNEVVMGKPIKLTMDDLSLTQARASPFVRSEFVTIWLFEIQPPAGYDSVVGEPGDVLNYDESIGELYAILVSLITHYAASV